MWRFFVNLQQRNKHKERLLKFDEAPEYQRFNPYIRTGYRSTNTYTTCLKSLVYLHNETLNIWTHLIGFIAFGILLAWDFYSPPTRVSWQDFGVILCIITCYQTCMILSAVYHTFAAHSQEVYDTCLFWDLAGIGASITASYISGIYYAFFCQPFWRNFYLSTVGLIILKGVFFRTYLNHEKNLLQRLVYFVTFAVYGAVPTIHWVIMSGGFDCDIVKIFLPRIVIMYCILGLAFLVYLGKFPERFLPGTFDILGSSHQWWHVLVFLCLAYWHNTGFTFAEFRLENQCSADIDPELKQRIKDNFWIHF